MVAVEKRPQHGSHLSSGDINDWHYQGHQRFSRTHPTSKHHLGLTTFFHLKKIPKKRFVVIFFSSYLVLVCHASCTTDSQSHGIWGLFHIVLSCLLAILTDVTNTMKVKGITLVFKTIPHTVYLTKPKAAALQNPKARVVGLAITLHINSSWPEISINLLDFAFVSLGNPGTSSEVFSGDTVHVITVFTMCSCGCNTVLIITLCPTEAVNTCAGGLNVVIKKVK